MSRRRRMLRRSAPVVTASAVTPTQFKKSRHRVTRFQMPKAPVDPRATTLEVKPRVVVRAITVVWDSLRRERPWEAEPTKVKIYGSGFDSLPGNHVRIVLRYRARYPEDVEGSFRIGITSRTDRFIELTTDRESAELALTSLNKYLGLIDEMGNEYMSGVPMTINKVTPPR